MRGNPGAEMRRQRGLAMVYGLFVLVGGLLALFFFFNTGQLAREKTQLVNTADAVAYSAGVLHAKSLNYLAYTNRAYIANEVLVAQAVSLSSWAHYLGVWQRRLGSVHPECYSNNPWAMAAGVAFKYDVDYGVVCWLMAWDTSTTEYVWALEQAVPPVVDAVIGAVAVSQTALQASQSVLMLGMNPLNPIDPSRRSALEEVARLNYPNDPDGVAVYAGLEAGLPDDWSTFTELRRRSPRRGQEDRTRLRDMAVQAADADPFVHQRAWTSRAVLPVQCGWGFRHNEVRRRGGTTLWGFDEWHAVDTQSWIRYWTRWRWSGPQCRSTEHTTGYARSEAYDTDQADGRGWYGGARNDTPRSFSSARRTRNTGYGGIPEFFDLSPQQLSKRGPDEPVLRLGVRVERRTSSLRTTDGAAQVHVGQGRLSRFDTQGATSPVGRTPAMHAVATSEVYYRNPQNDSELGSLFQPYWQVRLATTAVAGQWAQLGVR